MKAGIYSADPVSGVVFIGTLPDSPGLYMTAEEFYEALPGLTSGVVYCAILEEDKEIFERIESEYGVTYQ